MIELNQKAPDFTLADSKGKKIALKSYKNKKNVVLIMYPGDDTPGCTTQLTAVRDDYQAFTDANAVVIGINHADAASHEAFIKKYSLKTPLLIDKSRAVIKKYDATKQFFKNEVTKRSVVIIDTDGIIRYIKRGLPSDEELLETLQFVNSSKIPKLQKKKTMVLKPKRQNKKTALKKAKPKK